MKRSVYSLVLADKVIEEIDKMAYEMNTSRSNLINQILAEKVRLLTPEMRMREIFGQITRLMGENFQTPSQTSEAMMSIKSPLRYKYRPTIKYNVELFRDFIGRVGTVKISFRSQNRQLIQMVSEFFSLWAEIENKYIGRYFSSGVPCRMSEGKFERDFYEAGDGSPDDIEISEHISRYIRLVDKCIQLYFDNQESPAQTAAAISELYSRDLRQDFRIL